MAKIVLKGTGAVQRMKKHTNLAYEGGGDDG